MAGKRKGSGGSSKTSKKARTEEDGEQSAPFVNWRVVLTGDFTVRLREDLVDALKERDVAITGAISGKTTHLILGSKSSKAQYGGVSGVGGSKHAKAMEKGIPIISEKSVWDVINGKAENVEILEDGGKSDPSHQIDGAVATYSGKKRIGLPETKVKGSKWLGIMQGDTKDATGRAKCKVCDSKIEKGEKQVQLTDDSMFKAAGGKSKPNGRSDPLEDVKGLGTVTKSTFWVREGCVDAAVKMCKEKFEEDFETWSEA